MKTNSYSNCFVINNYQVPKFGEDRFFWITALVVAIISGIVLAVSLGLYGVSWSALPPICAAVIPSLFLLVFSYKPPLEDGRAKSASNSVKNQPTADETTESEPQTENHTETPVFPPNRGAREGLLSLPNATLTHVLSFLPSVDLNRARRVCAAFKDCADDESLWESAAKRLNDNLGPEVMLFGNTRVRANQIDDSWRKGWASAQVTSQVSVAESSYFSIAGGIFYNYSPTGSLFSYSCDGEYKTTEYPLSLDALSDSKWIFMLNDAGGVACDGRHLFNFVFGCKEAEPIDFIYNGEARITAMCFCENDQLLIGTEKGVLQLYEKIDQSYVFKQNWAIVKAADEIVSIKSKGDWIAFMTKSPGKDHTLHLLNTKKHTFNEFPLHQKNKTCCFSLSEDYFVIGNDDRLFVCDLDAGGVTIPATSRTYSFAEIHAVEIQGDLLSIAFTRKVMLIDEDGKNSHWEGARVGENIPLNLYNFPLGYFLS